MSPKKLSDFLIVSVVSDDPFAIDVAHYFGQRAEISDLLSLKRFANTEFCPRFICDEKDLDKIGYTLEGKIVIIVTTHFGNNTRNALAMRTCILARAAKDNGAEHVIMIEPDLFYSAQDRGPRREHGNVLFKRNIEDYDKFTGQAFSALLYAQLLKNSGVDSVLTVHNHSVSVQDVFSKEMKHDFFNLSPAELYSHYLLYRDSSSTAPGLILCAPDKGAVPFVKDVFEKISKIASKLLIKPEISWMSMKKVRFGERHVEMDTDDNSPLKLSDVEGKDIVVFDDMVRTGHTIINCCKLLKKAKAKRVIFVVTHFYSSNEVKENLNDPAIDAIITTNTLPSILNRDMQGRLRKKILVLKIEKWIALFLREKYLDYKPPHNLVKYSIDISSKNPQWERFKKTHNQF